MLYLSSNQFSVDDQAADVISYLSLNDNYASLMNTKFLSDFPEYNNLTWSGSWVDSEASGVDPEYMSWVIDWLEANTPVTWLDGEPVIYERTDEEYDDDL